MHLLLSLFPRDRPSSPAAVDSIIRASWPDPEQEPLLFDAVKRSMVHGPCGRAFPHAPCMRDGKCSKGFPKPFQPVTAITTEGYPTYARPPNGHTYDIGGFPANNRWIVPYNPYLLMRCTRGILWHCSPSPARRPNSTLYVFDSCGQSLQRLHMQHQQKLKASND